MSIRHPFSPPGSSHASTTGGANAPRNIISKLVLEGSVKDGAHAAVIRLFAKVSVPEFPPGQAYPLFQEGSTRLLRSVCHPLTHEGAPYALPSNSTRLLRRAVRALNLPAPVVDEYPDHPPSPASPSSSQKGVRIVPELTTAATGAVIVSNREYCYHSPRVLSQPPNSGGTIRGKHRRSSMGTSSRDGPMSPFLIVMELSVPLASTPPHGPYMINMHIPRCLQNSLKLQLFAPPSSRPSRSGLSDFSSGISTASTDDERWEVRTIPPLLAPARPRSNSITSRQSLPDDDDDDDDEDESAASSSSASPNRARAGSEGSAGSSSGAEVVRGTFPSSERLIVRWAHASGREPLVKLRHIGESRKQVSVHRVDSTMRCSIRKPTRDGINLPVVPVRIDFEAICRGIIHPGVETSLALGVVIDSFGSNIDWAVTPDFEKGEEEMDITGDAAVTGWVWDSADVPPATPLDEKSRPGTPSRQLSATITPSAPSTPEKNYHQSRSLSSLPLLTNGNRPTPGATLLHAPLPGSMAAGVPDYSFETPPVSAQNDEIMSLHDGYFSSTRASSRRSSMNSIAADLAPRTMLRHPSDPFSVHINLLPLLSTSPKSMDIRFVVSLDILLSGSNIDPYNIALPSIRIPTAASHTCNIALRTDDPRNDIAVSAPVGEGAGKRVTERIGTTGVSWEVEIAPHKWGETLSAVVDDDLAEDCLLLVLPEPKKPRPTASPMSSPRLAQMQPTPSPSEYSRQDSPTFVNGTPLPAPHFARSQTSTPTRPGLSSVSTNMTITPQQTPQQTPAAALKRQPSTSSLARVGHSWVEINACPMPPSLIPDEKGKVPRWAMLIRVRMPWPSVSAGGSQRCDFGLVKPEDQTMAPIPELLDASIDGRRAEIQTFPTASNSLLGTFGSPSRGPTQLDPSAVDWLTYARITDPEARYGGTLEVLYRLEYPDARALDVLLPTFTVKVSRLEVTVADIPDYKQPTSTHNFELTTRAPLRFQHLSLPPYHTPRLVLRMRPSTTPLQRQVSRLATWLAVLAVIGSLVAFATDLQRLHGQVDRITSTLDVIESSQKHLGSRTLPTVELPEDSPKPSPTIDTPTVPPDPSSSTLVAPTTPDDPQIILPQETYFPSIPFPDDDLDDLQYTMPIPVTTIYPSTLAEPTPTNSDNQYSSSYSASRMGGSLSEILADPLRNPLTHLFNFAPRFLARKVWGFVILLFHYPLEPL